MGPRQPAGGKAQAKVTGRMGWWQLSENKEEVIVVIITDFLQRIRQRIYLVPETTLYAELDQCRDLLAIILMMTRPDRDRDLQAL